MDKKVINKLEELSKEKNFYFSKNKYGEYVIKKSIIRNKNLFSNVFGNQSLKSYMDSLKTKGFHVVNHNYEYRISEKTSSISFYTRLKEELAKCVNYLKYSKDEDYTLGQLLNLNFDEIIENHKNSVIERTLNNSMTQLCNNFNSINQSYIEINNKYNFIYQAYVDLSKTNNDLIKEIRRLENECKILREEL